MIDIVKRTEDLDERVTELERKMEAIATYFYNTIRGLERSTGIDRE